MTFNQFALKNLMRNKWRSVLTVISISVATLTIFIILSIDKGYKMSVEEELVKNTGVHLYITLEGCPMEAASVIAQGGLSPLYVPEDILDKIKHVEGIRTVMPFKIFALTTPDGSRTDIFFGITPEIQKIRPNWELKEGFWFKNENSIILGNMVAITEKRSVGDKVYFEQFDKEFEIVGILEANYTQDDGAFFIPLNVAQKLIGRERKLSAVAIQVEDIEKIDKIKNTLRATLSENYFVITAQSLSEGVLGFFGSTRAIMFIMIIVSLTVSTLGIMNTLLMTALERRKEFAYLKCTGASILDIFKLVFLETVILCLSGIFLGVVLTILLSSGFENFLRQHLVVFIPKARIVRIGLDMGILSAVIIILSGFLAAFYPAVKTAQIVPMEAIRNE
ncbi:MAG: ABC transporter permease [Endomicrobiia bacterium]